MCSLQHSRHKAYSADGNFAPNQRDFEKSLDIEQTSSNGKGHCRTKTSSIILHVTLLSRGNCILPARSGAEIFPPSPFYSACKRFLAACKQDSKHLYILHSCKEHHENNFTDPSVRRTKVATECGVLPTSIHFTCQKSDQARN